MKRAATYGLIAVLAAALIGAASWGAVWLGGTTRGARWLMDSVSRHTPLKISARKVEGRLLYHLHLEDVRLSLPPFEVEIKSLDYRWHPIRFMSGRIAAEELTLAGVHIRDNTPRGIPPDLAWPRISGIAGRIDGRIDRLAVNGLTYRRLDSPPIALDVISSSVSWQNGLLSLSHLAVAMPAGRVAGKIAAGFDRPSLAVDLSVTLAKPVAGMDAVSLQGLFRQGRSPEQLAGGFSIAGSSGKTKFLELAGEAGMTRQVFNLRQLRMVMPSRRGSVTGGGSVTLTAREPLLEMQLRAAGLDLAQELNVATDLSGTLTIAGTPELYRGEFSIANGGGKGWQTARLAGSYQGNNGGVKLAPLTGALLAGSVQGNLDLLWGEEVSLKGTLRGRNLNPAGISPDWAGMVNFDLAGSVAWTSQAPPRGEMIGRLLESRLHGEPLTGELRADFARGDLHIGRLNLRGKGFDISAAGTLGKRLDFAAQAGALGRLIPRAAGELRAKGWVRWRDGRLDGAVEGRGANLAAAGMRIAAANGTARLGEGKGAPLHVAAKLRKVAYDRFKADSVTIEADGTLLRHTIEAEFGSPGVEARIALSGGYERGSWRGEIVRFSGRDSVGPWSLETPSSLSFAAGRMALAPLILTGVQPERIEIAGELIGQPRGGSVRAVWSGLNLARANPWLPRELHIDGLLTGRVEGKSLPGERLDLTGQVSLVRGKIRWRAEKEALDADLQTADLSWSWQGALSASAADIGAGRLVVSGRSAASGIFTTDGHPVTVERSSMSLDGNERGLRAGMELHLAGGGLLKGTFSSPAPARVAPPETGEVKAEWTGIDMALLRPWLPRAANFEGRLAGRASGELLPGRRFAMKGDASLSGGKVRWLRPEGEINVNLRSASASWDWRGETLKGDLALAMAEQGQAQASFQLPIPAHLPASIDRKDSLQASLTGQVREMGLLGSLFPGFVQESHGELNADLRVSGSWEDPKIEGGLKMAAAGAYLPTAGIHVRDVQLAIHLEKNLLRIDSFRAVSGPGHIEGTALVRLKEWQVASYRGSVNGERFQFVYLPELQILGSPRLTFEGTPEKLAIRGEVRLPELLIFGPPTRTVVLSSRDVILEGKPKPAEKSFPLALDVQVRMILGEKVLAKVGGIDAQLGGQIDLMFQSLERIASRGEIRVVKGRYKAYGVDLEIVRGRLFYTGGPINQPTLDILALRTVGDVRAGVTAGGILRAPAIKLYSEPVMPDVDVLAYIVFGHPLSNSSNSEQAGMMAQVASVLLSRGQSAVLQEQIKNRLGLSTLEIQSGSAETTGRMGYRAIPATPTGVAPAKQGAGVSETMLTVGKYLTPQLYFSYGRSLFTGGNMFRLRYDIFKDWQIETQTGRESGVDIYYKIEFN